MQRMQPVTRERLEELIEKAKAAGKDVSELEEMLAKGLYSPGQKPSAGKAPAKSEVIVTINSTGPVKEEDFEEKE